MGPKQKMLTDSKKCPPPNVPVYQTHLYDQIIRIVLRVAAKMIQLLLINALLP